MKINPAQGEKLFGISESTIRSAMNRGILPSERVGKHRVFETGTLARLLSEGTIRRGAGRPPVREKPCPD